MSENPSLQDLARKLSQFPQQPTLFLAILLCAGNVLRCLLHLFSKHWEVLPDYFDSVLATLKIFSRLMFTWEAVSMSNLAFLKTGGKMCTFKTF